MRVLQAARATLQRALGPSASLGEENLQRRGANEGLKGMILKLRRCLKRYSCNRKILNALSMPSEVVIDVADLLNWILTHQ